MDIKLIRPTWRLGEPRPLELRPRDGAGLRPGFTCALATSPGKGMHIVWTLRVLYREDWVERSDVHVTITAIRTQAYSMENSRREFSVCPFSYRYSAIVCVVVLELLLLLSMRHMHRSFQHHPITVRNIAQQDLNMRGTNFNSLTILT